jgi:hypothetical protein
VIWTRLAAEQLLPKVGACAWIGVDESSRQYQVATAGPIQLLLWPRPFLVLRREFIGKRFLGDVCVTCERHVTVEYDPKSVTYVHHDGSRYPKDTKNGIHARSSGFPRSSAVLCRRISVVSVHRRLQTRAKRNSPVLHHLKQRVSL